MKQRNYLFLSLICVPPRDSSRPPLMSVSPKNLLDPVTASQVRSSQVKSSQVKSSQVKSSQVNSIQIIKYQVQGSEISPFGAMWCDIKLHE